MMSSPTAKKAADIKNDNNSTDDDDLLLWNEIVAAFQEDGFQTISKNNINGAIREELLSIYKSFSFTSSSKFVIAWEAFVSKTANIKDDVKVIPSVENIESFREYVLREDLMAKEIKGLKSSTNSAASSNKNNNKKKLSKFERQVQKKARVMMSMGDHLEMHDEDVHGKMEVVGVGAASTADVVVDGNKDDFEPVLKTPFKETNNALTSSSLPASIAAQMKTPGSYRKAKKKTTTSSTLVKTIFEGALGDFNASETSSSKEAEISFSELVSSALQEKLFMRDRIEDKVALLKNKFVPFNNNNNDKEEEEEGEGDEQQQTTTTTVVGRVCCDSSDRQELQLESSDGSRVKLELRSVENEYSLFPGQIVKCVGANPTGYCFVAKEIDCYYFKQEKEHESSSSSSPSSSSSSSPTEMLVFSGPFTANDDLMYEPLDDVLHEASSSKNPASVVLLMGPFVSDENINHALASNITFKQAFEQIVMKKIEAFAKQYPNKHVVLVPSVKDAFHRYCAFPQTPFNHSSSKCKNIHFVANPSAFEVNGIRVAVSTCDVLKHLSGFERGGKGKNTDNDAEKKQQQTDRMTRLCSHLVGQKSMYPLFPPHPDARFETHDATAPLRVGMDERVPDLIVLTSDLAAGGWKNALSGNKTMFVNPGKVCRGVNAGTFCKVSYSGSKEKSSSFAESARLELHKL